MSSIMDIFKRIKIRAPLLKPKVLELFCGTGDNANEYGAMCESIEAWDNNESKARSFKERVSQATVRVCNVFEVLTGYKEHRFDVVIIDNSVLTSPRYEHFDLFPGIYRLMNPTCFVVLSTVTDPFGYADNRRDLLTKSYGGEEGAEKFLEEWDAARDKFYGLTPLSPENMPKKRPVSSIRLQDMEPIYQEKFEKAGFKVPYTFSCMRNNTIAWVMVEAHMEPVVEKQEEEKPKRKKKAAGFGALGGVLGGSR